MTRRGATPRPGRPVRGSTTGQPINALLDLLGRRSALAIIWCLRDGPLSFRTLQLDAGGVAASTLNARLRELRDVQIVDLGPDGYRLTPDGEELLAASADLLTWVAGWSQRLQAGPTP